MVNIENKIESLMEKFEKLSSRVERLELPPFPGFQYGSHSVPWSYCPPLQPIQSPQPRQPIQSPQPLQPIQSPQPLQQPDAEDTKCLPIKHRETNYLESSEIQAELLGSSKVTLSKYTKLKNMTKVGQLAIKLAKETYFGEDVMSRCTVIGYGKYPALPETELNSMKQTLFNLFSSQSNPIEFEVVWKDAVEAVGQACKRLRHEKENNPVLID